MVERRHGFASRDGDGTGQRFKTYSNVNQTRGPVPEWKTPVEESCAQSLKRSLPKTPDVADT